MYFNTHLVASAALLGLAAAAPAASVSPSPTRSFTGGTVIGKATTVVSASSTATAYNYLGIPFAAVPTGSLRFKPPQTPVTLSQPLQATAFPAGCLEQLGNSTVDTTVKNIGPPPSEDCLYLNVFAPTDASSTNKKPVLFWIFGGDLFFGSGSVNYYNGSSFAAYQDVIVVTFNYRTNIFGFSNSPQLEVKDRNAGFLDQRAALTWTKQNIAGFGGDPSQITIFGESAGGYSVKQLLANPPSNPPPYRAAIMESEALFLPANGTASYETVADHFGCTDAATQLQCLQKISAKDIETYITQPNATIYFPPTDDNSTNSNDVRPNIASKRWANVPYFLGTNSGEGNSFAYGLVSGNATVSEILNTLLPGQGPLVQLIVSIYQPFSDSVGNATYPVLSRIITDYIFQCPAAELAQTTIENGYTSVWRYYYDAAFPNLSYFPNAGAYHSSEIPQVFGTYDLQNYLGSATPDQIGLSKYMQTAWANFAKNPANGPGWPKYNSTPKDVGDLGGINKTGEVDIDPTVTIDLLCPALAPLILSL